MLKDLLLNKYYVFFLFAGITVLVFGNTFPNQWVYDDYGIATGNPDVQSFSGFLNSNLKGRPLRKLSYLFDYKLFGNNPFGYHIQQILWHTANSCLLFLLIRRLTDNLIAILLGTLLFTIHPLQSESVAHIGHRKELLPLFFGLSSLLSYLKATTSSKWKRLGWLVFSTFLFILLLLSNVTAITLPFIYILFEYLFLDEKNYILLKKPLLPKFLMLIFLIITFFYAFNISLLTFKHNLGTLYIQNGYMNTNEYWPFITGIFRAFTFYIYKILFPISLAIEYSMKYSNNILQWDAWLGLTLLISTIFIFLKSIRHLPLLSFGLGWFLIFYIPISNIYPSGYVLADRYMYLCLPGLSMALASVLQYKMSKVTLFITLILLSIFSILTMIQNTYWHDSYSLSQQAVRVNPNSSGANWLRAKSAIEEGELETAKFYLEKVLSINRFMIPPHLSLAKVEERLGNLRAALEHYEFVEKYSRVNASTRAHINSLRYKINNMDKEN